MYMLLAAAAIAALIAARLAGRALFDDAHRLRPLPPARGREHRLRGTPWVSLRRAAPPFTAPSGGYNQFPGSGSCYRP
jgi:hypothetical protein